MIIERDMETEKKIRIVSMLSYPRSGSHWTRRMVAEVVSRYYDIPVSFGKGMNEQMGFLIKSIEFFKTANCPWQFLATHELFHFNKPSIYLRRDFESVLRSTRKAEKELPNCWWGGETDEDVYKKWSEHVASGTVRSGLVIDYQVTRSDPKATVRAILDHAGFPYSNEDLEAAVKAGSRENMLREQEINTPDRKWDVINKAGATLCV